MSADSHTRHYIKIWAILVVLLVVSVIGPMFGHKWLTLVTAFGVACVKAFLVCKHFMHLDIEKAMMRWLLITSVVLMGLFYAGTAPDVMEHTGHNWVNDAAIAAAERGVGGGHHGEGAHEVPAHGEGAHGDAAGSHEEAAATDEEPAAPEGAATEAATEEPGAEAAAADANGDASADATASAPGFDAQAAFKTTCSTCHGEAGDGNGPVGAALDPKPANFTDPAFWEARDDATVHKAIKEGGAAVGKSPMMAPWSGTYDDAQIDAIVSYLHTLNTAGSAEAGEATP